jgi:hypothetical protein
MTAVAQGVLFGSFEEQANYESKKAELRRLGLLVDVDETGPSAAADGGGAQVTESQPAIAGDNQTVAALKRQVEHRESISALINAKSTEESNQYNSIISALRAEIVRREFSAEDRTAALSAQVEALHAVLERRKDSTSDAIVKYTDVELQCRESLSAWREEIRRHVDASQSIGEQSIAFINDMRKTCEQLADEEADPMNAAMQREVAVVKDLMSEATRVRVTLLQGRLHPLLTAESLNKLRLMYAIGPGRVSDNVVTLIAEEMRAEISGLTERIAKDQSSRIHTALSKGVDDASVYCPIYLSNEIDRLRNELHRLSNSRLQAVAADQRQQAANVRLEMQAAAKRCVERRVSEEQHLREAVVELTRLLADQRAETQTLRAQLMANISSLSRATQSKPPAHQQVISHVSEATNHRQRTSRGSSRSRRGGPQLHRPRAPVADLTA